MTKDKGRLSIVISALCTLIVLGLAPATAGATELVPPTDGTGSTTTTSTTTDSTTASGGTQTDNNHPRGIFTPRISENETQTEVQDYQKQGNTYLLQMREKMKAEHAQNQTQTAANRQKRCVELQSMVDKQIANFSSSAQTHLTTFNNVYAKVQAYATGNTAASANVQSLITAANTQQTNATQAVAALKSVAVTVDCTAQDPASSLATIKSAVESTRSALQAYQQAIKAVISSLESAANTQTTTTTTTNTQQ